jgi:hypothetical protein
MAWSIQKGEIKMGEMKLIVSVTDKGITTEMSGTGGDLLNAGVNIVAALIKAFEGQNRLAGLIFKDAVRMLLDNPEQLEKEADKNDEEE